MIKKIIPVLGFALVTFIFFWQVFFKGLLPIPADTIVGLYHPYRDFYSKEYPNGIPFKNFLITDPIRQQYPWKNLSVGSFKNFEIPSWNPYSFSGTPHLANFQSAVFYPFNLIFLFPSFEISWTLLIILQTFLAGLFLYYFLRNLRLDEYSSFFGGIIFAFSGFFVTWLEWGNLLHTALWLPLILLSIDKVILYLKSQKNDKQLSLSNIRVKNGKIFTWSGIFVFAFLSSFFAGHLQTFFYLLSFSLIYLILRILQNKNKLKISIIFLILGLMILIITLPQSMPSMKFILLSGRGGETLLWKNEGWFIPLQHLIQFIIPDFFGNPSTLNYWGTWNYGELTGFIGIVGIIFALFAVLFRRDKKTLLLTILVILTLVFALPNFFSRIPFIFNFPFISTAQPTRVLFITDFSLSILAALGFNYFIVRGKLRQVIIPILIIGFILSVSFVITQFGIFNINPDNLSVAKRNIIFPGLIFAITLALILIASYVRGKYKKFLIVIIIIIAIFELFRFSWKFNTFSKPEYLYPKTASINYIKNNIDYYRIATADPRIMAPNFSVAHGLQSVEGYDPLYISRYGEFIAAVNRNTPDINPPFGFNRIIRIENMSSNLVDLMGVKYVLSLTELDIKGFRKTFEENDTKIYENEQVLPRVFFVKNVKAARSKNESIRLMFENDFNPRETAVVEEKVSGNLSEGIAEIVEYSENEVIIKTSNKSRGFLVLTDSFYPSWHVRINGKEDKIYLTDYVFRGVIVPAGENVIVFKNSLL